MSSIVIPLLVFDICADVPQKWLSLSLRILVFPSICSDFHLITAIFKEQVFETTAQESDPILNHFCQSVGPLMPSPFNCDSFRFKLFLIK